MKPWAILVDIDGTMALKGTRSPYDMDRVLEDEPNEPVITVVDALQANGFQVIYLSGRFERARADTQKWLNLHTTFPYAALYMRADDDMRRDWRVKYEIYKEHIEPFYRIKVVFDDRDTVVNMWRSQLKLPCLQVADGDF